MNKRLAMQQGAANTQCQNVEVILANGFRGTNISIWECIFYTPKYHSSLDVIGWMINRATFPKFILGQNQTPKQKRNRQG
eukprot:snap_masked-scaffold_15-processed-gene-8.30-mRNA-1 protein AED:1.00 eAED:1.00 QI:0/-1/0/0/-1/1/1/0/79